MKKRKIAWLLVLTMLFTLVPTNSYAADLPDNSIETEVSTEASTESEVSTEETTETATEETTTETAIEESEENEPDSISVDEETTEESTEEATEAAGQDSLEVPVLMAAGDSWKIIGVASPSINVGGRTIIGSQYTVQSLVTGEVLGAWCYDHNKTTAAVGSGLTEASGNNKLVAISCLVAQGNGAMASFYAGFNWQGYNPEVVATLANSILAGNSSSGSFGAVVDSYVAYIRSLENNFTMVHPHPVVVNNDSELSYDSASGLYYSKTIQLQVPEDAGNALTWKSEPLPEGVYAKIGSLTSINTQGCIQPGQSVTLRSNESITYLFDSKKISAAQMERFSQNFNLEQFIVNSITFTPHGGYQPVIYASYQDANATVQMGSVARGRLGFQKRSSNASITNSCSLYSLAGAEYVLKNEKGQDAKFIVASSSTGDVYANTSTAKLITNQDGYLTYKFNYSGPKSDITALYSKVSGSNPYTITFDSNNKIVCDMGTYRLSETKASPGYKKDENCRYDVKDKYHEVTLTNAHRNAYIICREEPILDPIHVRLNKLDMETGELNPVGAGSLAGAVFEVDYYNGKYTKNNLPGRPTRRWYFQTDENGYWNFSSGNTLNNEKYHSDEMYPGNKIPLGTVTIREITAPTGYLRTWDGNNGQITIDGNAYSDNKMVLYQIVMNAGNTAAQRLLDGTTVSAGNQVITIRAYDPVSRGNLEFDKKEYGTNNNMPYQAFILESTTTHEKHIIVTDENSHATTDFAAFNNSRKNVNGNDKYLNDLENPDVVNNKLRPTPVYFYGTADESKWDVSKIKTNRGALPYDTYTITEIASEGNAHTRLVVAGEYTFTVSKNQDMDSQTVFDMELPVIHTTALSEDTNDHIAGAYKTAKVIDTVRYENLYPEKKYKLVGTAMNQKTGKPITLDGKLIQQEVEFTTPEAERLANGYQDVVFTFDATLLKGTTMVVFEKLYMWDEEKEEWTYVVDHEDMNDEGQSVHFTDVHTTATDSDTQSHDSYAVREVTIIDKVYCSNLIKGRNYTIKGMIMVIPDEVDDSVSNVDYTYRYDATTGSYVDQNGIECHPYLVDGKPVTAEKTFVAEKTGDCVVELAFTFDARPLKNRSINVFEDLYNENGIRIGTHADLRDEDQTIIFHPKDTSISILTRNKIDGAGSVKTGDIPLVLFIILLLMSIIAAVGISSYRHKSEKLKKVKVNHRLHLLLAVILLSGMIAGGVYASDVIVKRNVKVDGKIYDYQLISTYDADSENETYDFKEKYEGAKLVETSYEVLDKKYPDKTVTTEEVTKNLTKKDESLIDESIEKDGVTYELKDISWEEIPVIEEVEYTMNFGNCTSEPAYPETYDYTYHSPTTGEDVTVTLPFVRLNKGEDAWVDGFSADVTFHNLEGEIFTLGNHSFSYNENLQLTQADYTELVKLLGYDTSMYRLNSFSWNGAVYENEKGEQCRNGIVSGQQFASHYTAYYADKIETGKIYTAKATYEAVVTDEDAAPTGYQIQATALYKNTGIWSNVIQFVITHKAASGIFAFSGILIVALIVGILLMKKKNSMNTSKDE